MSNQEEENILVEKYLDNKLDPEERKAFEERLLLDQNLKEKVEEMKILMDGFEELRVEELTSEYQKWQEEEQTPKADDSRETDKKPTVAKIRRFQISRWAVAASILILIGIGMTSYARLTHTNQLISKANYVVPGFSNDRQRSEAENPPDRLNSLDAAIQALSEGEFVNSINFLSSIPSDSPEFIKARFFLAHAYYQTSEYDKAIEAYKTVIQSGDSRYKSLSEINLLTTYLSGNKTAGEFNSLLDQLLEQEDHPHHQQAKAIQHKMNSFWRKLIW